MRTKAMNMKRVSAFLAALWILSAVWGCTKPKEDGPSPTGKLVVFHAGSLSVPFRELSRAFQARYPDVEVVCEAAGSRTCARKISDLGRPCDIMASADYTVIESLLMPEYADWNISFAVNEMAVMYRSDSPYADEIDGDNWYDILLREDVEYGHSDPDADPCGYRTLLVWQLAEKHYRVPGLYERLVRGCPEKNIRPKETDLIALLQAGQIDYLFIYRSICKQHGMPFVLLPPVVNLGDPRFADSYAQARVKVSGKRPGTWIVKKGAPMIYGVTIPRNGPNRAGATAFLCFLLGPEGRKILIENGQQPILPPRVTGRVEALPPALARCVQ